MWIFHTAMLEGQTQTDDNGYRAIKGEPRLKWAGNILLSM